MWHAYLNASGHWQHPEFVESYFSKDHVSSGRGVYMRDDGSQEALAMFDHGRFLVDASMERGCKPLLTVQFAPSSRHKSKLWDAKESVKTPKNGKLVEGTPLVDEAGSTPGIVKRLLLS